MSRLAGALVQVGHVTDDKVTFRERREALTSERESALEAATKEEVKTESGPRFLENRSFDKGLHRMAIQTKRS